MSTITSRSLVRRYLPLVAFGLVIGIVAISFLFSKPKTGQSAENRLATPLARAYESIYTSTGVAGSSADMSGTVISTFAFQPPDRLQISIASTDHKTTSLFTNGMLYQKLDDAKWHRASAPTRDGENSFLEIVPRDALTALSHREQDAAIFSPVDTPNCPAEKKNCKAVKEKRQDQQSRVYYIDADNGRLIKVDDLYGDKVVTTTQYEYRPVSVTIPPDSEIDTGTNIAK